MERIQLFNNHFQNFKVYGIPHAQLIIADPPYNLGNNAYASNPMWYKGGDNKNGESELAGKQFFDTDKDFRPAEFMHFCSQMLVKEPKNGVTDNDINEFGQQKDETIGGGIRRNPRPLVWYYSVPSSRCTTILTSGKDTDSSTTFRLCSIRITLHKY